MDKINAGHLLDSLFASAKSEKGMLLYDRFLQPRFISYAQLLRDASVLCQSLGCRGVPKDSQVIIQLSDNLQFLISFWACLLGGYVPVPLSCVASSEAAKKLWQVFQQSERPVILTGLLQRENIATFLGERCEPQDIERICKAVLIVDELVANSPSDGVIFPDNHRQKTAFIQYSSGSTGEPKGVVLSHENVLSNIKDIGERIRITEQDKTLSWLPLSHDMGLIGFHLVPLVFGCDQVIIETANFIRRPACWLELVSQTRASITVSPNFGLKHLSKQVPPEKISPLQLASLRLVFNGAESISYQVCRDFLAVYEDHGLNADCLFPVYGMAEASLAVTFPQPGSSLTVTTFLRESLVPGKTAIALAGTENQERHDAITLVAVGTPLAGCSVNIISPQEHVCADGQVGYIAIKGKNVTRGYYRAEKALGNKYGLNTGDLGLFYQGQLYITGRAKELFSINGQNYYSTNLEQYIESLAIQGAEHTAVVGVINAQGQEEVICFVRFKGAPADFIPLRREISAAIAEAFHMEIAHILPVKQLPKTTSGKLKRTLLQQQYLNGQFADIIQNQHDADERSSHKYTPQQIAESILSLFKSLLSEQSIAIDDNFLEIGGDSALALRLKTRLSQRFSIELEDSVLFKYPTIRTLSHFIWQRLTGNSEEQPPAANGPTRDTVQDIAIIGISCRFPGARNSEEFWHNLSNGVDSVSHFSQQELADSGIPEQWLARENYIRAKGIIDDSDYFAAGFFNYSPSEAEKLDPQMRFLHECAWEAFEYAGYDPINYAGPIGVYVGASPNPAWQAKWQSEGSQDARHFLDTQSADKDFSATRLSYKLNLTGPSVTLYTACSTGLAAVEMACQGLLSGSCEMALAGAASVLLPIKRGYFYQPGMLFAQDGVNRSFDAKASGSVFSDGVGLVLLKKLDRARQDNDNILAVIKGIAINNDGQGKAGYTAPSMQGQAQVIAAALQISAVDAETISYVETHGSATPLGDSIEIDALKQALDRPGNVTLPQCALGSVKSQVGHMNTAAGIGGLIKVVLMLQHRQLPANLHVNQVNPNLQLENSRFYINQQHRPWQGNVLRAGVSSFGIGGTNVHAILEQAPVATCNTEPTRPLLFLLTAKTAQELGALKALMLQYISQQPSALLADIAYTLQVGRHHFPFRSCFICQTRQEVQDYLSGVLPARQQQVTDAKIHQVQGELEQTLLSASGTPAFAEQLQQLATGWLAGARIDWSLLYPNQQHRRLPLPTYPFSRECYPLTPKVPASYAENAKQTSVPQDIDIYCYYPEWQLAEQTAPQPDASLLADGVILITQPTTLASMLENGLEDIGVKSMVLAQDSLVTEADYGNAFARIIAEQGHLPKLIVHQANIVENPLTEQDSYQRFILAYQRVCLLFKALQPLCHEHRVQVILLSNSLADEFDFSPELAAISGPLQAIHPEAGNIHTGVLEIDWPQPTAQVAEQLKQQLLVEITRPFGNSGQKILLRGQQRWLPQLREMIAPEYNAAAPGLKKRGVYVILGGLGGVGYALAQYLAQQWQATLILIGKTPLPQAAQWETWLADHGHDDRISIKIRQAQRLRRLGATLWTLNADLADPRQITDVFSQIHRRYPRIQGVIHAVGVADGALIVNRRLDADRAFFSSKVQGTLALSRILQSAPPDFLLFCSSIAAVLNLPGQAAYISANNFIDDFCRYFSQRIVSKVVAVNWDHWRDLEYSTFNQHDIFNRISEQRVGLSAAQAGLALLRALAAEQSQIVICAAPFTTRQAQIQQVINAVTSHSQVNIRPRPTLNVNYVAPGSHEEQRLATIIQKFTGLQQVGIHDNYFELGLTSLDIFQINQNLMLQLGRELPITAFYTYPTIRLYANFLTSNEAPLAPPIHRLTPPHAEAGGGIAIIGMAGRFPGAVNVEAYWQNLLAGIESVQFFSRESLLAAGIDPLLLDDPNYVSAKGYLADTDCFDHEFFGFSPREAQVLSPQVRLTYECVWSALENAGYPPDSHELSIGCFLGASHNTYWEEQVKHSAEGDSLGEFVSTLLSHKAFMATRIAHKLNLNGPAINLFTGCSTSAVTVHQACQSLMAGECDMAVAGGVSVEFPVISGYLYQPGMLFSQDGHCRSFDEQASGSCFGDGVGIVVLKPLHQALADGDVITAVIKGSAINNDGAMKVGYTAPSVKGQAAVIAKAQHNAGIVPDNIGYVETHGSGTPVGDPIELTALNSVIPRHSDTKAPCYIGSVKSNIGHLNTASGIAALIKTAKIIQTGEIPPSLHLTQLTSRFDFANSRLTVCTQRTLWPKIAGPRRAGVSSFGIGGTNVHLLLEEAPPQIAAPTQEKAGCLHLLLLQAKNLSALRQMGAQLITFLQQQSVCLADLAYSLQVTRTPMPWCRMVICHDRQDAISQLRQEWETLEFIRQCEDRFYVSVSSTARTENAIDLMLYHRNLRQETEQVPRLRQCLQTLQQQVGATFRLPSASSIGRQILPLPTYPFARLSHWLGAQPAVSLKAENVEQTHSYTPMWLADGAVTACEGEGCCLLLCQQQGLQGSNLQQRLWASGMQSLLVTNGEKAGQDSDDSFTACFSDVQQLTACFHRLKQASRLPRTVVHYGSGENSEDAQKALSGLVNIIRAYKAVDGDAELKLLIITQYLYSDKGGSESACQAVKTGFARVINQEYRDIHCQLVDFESDKVADIAAGLLFELANPSGQVIVLYRAAQRWLAHWQSSRLTGQQSPGFRQGGVYLITGGLGNIGFALALRLIHKFQAKIVIITRSDGLSDYQQQQLSGKQNNLLICQGSCANPDQLQQSVTEAEQVFGPIHGVIHAAGWASEESVSVIENMDEAFIRRHFDAKVAGTQALVQIFADKSLDFCLLMSSISAQLGGIGMAAYAGVNHYLDCMARYQMSKGLPWISVNWDRWQGARGWDNAYLKRVLGERQIAVEHGLDCIEHIVQNTANCQLLVSGKDVLGQLNTQDHIPIASATVADETNGLPLRVKDRTHLNSRFVDARNPLERLITDVFEEHFGFSGISIHDNFFDLGASSVDLVRLHLKLNKRVETPLTIANFLNYHSIYTLARFIEGDAATDDPQLSGDDPEPNADESTKPGDSPPPSVADEMDIAIIGMAAQFPGAPNIDTFWQNLLAGVESISRFSPQELRSAGVPESLIRDPSYVPARGILPESQSFDAAFFGYSFKEAQTMDPQTRVMHECAWRALEHAGYDPQGYAGKIGLYAGGGPHPYWSSVHSSAVVRSDKPSEQYATVQLSDKDFSASRIAYKLGLKGNTLSVFTACSTGLVAVHLAASSLLQGECDMALAGGASVWLPQKMGYLHEQGMILSADGHHRAFDAQASGSVFSDGVGVVLLKKLTRAIADGDSIHCVIKGTAINNDGNRKLGYTAPSVEGQVEVINGALARARITPAQLNYIETHGSATSLGDVVEIEALKKVFAGDNNVGAACVLGAVKSNIGHTNSAAGMAGLIKTALVLKYRQIPPTLHFHELNPNINLQDGRLQINSTLQPLSGGVTSCFAGVSAFGIGGTNAHVILQGYEDHTVTADSAGPWLLPLSAKSPSALAAASASLGDYLQQNPAIKMADVAYTLQVGRPHFEYRTTVMCHSLQEAIDAFTGTGAGNILSGHCKRGPQAIAFMLPGQSAQYINMGRALYDREPLFRQVMDACFSHYQTMTGEDIAEVLYPAHHDIVALTDTALSQPLLFMFEYALGQLLIGKAIRPSLLIGYSFGEYAAACIAGVFSYQDALDLIIIRGRLMQLMPAGKMLSTTLAKEQLTPLLSGSLSIAIENPSSLIVSGLEDDVLKLEKALKTQRCFCFPVDIHHLAHSPLLKKILPAFKAALANVRFHAPQIPYISNVTGKRVTAEQATSSDFWCQHLTQTVKFSQGLDCLLEQVEGVALELGPGHDLSVLLRSKAPTATRLVAINLVANKHEAVDSYGYFLAKIGQMWLHGGVEDWQILHCEARKRIPLPGYIFEKQFFPLEPSILSETAWQGVTKTIHKTPELQQWFYRPTWRPLALASDDAGTPPPAGCILVFMDDIGVASEVCSILSAQGHTPIAVAKSSSFRQFGERSFAINPACLQDYLDLFSALRGRLGEDLQLYHFFSLGKPEDPLDADDIAPMMSVGFYSLLHIANALAETTSLRQVTLSVISNHLYQIAAEQHTAGAKGALQAACLVIPQEHPHIQCHSIDVMVPDHPRQRSRLIQQLCRFLMAKSSRPAAAILRDNSLWGRSYERLAANAAQTTATPIRKRGVYLITGGFGGIGRLLASHLATQYQASVILSTRGMDDNTEKGREKHQWLQTLRASGAQVEIICADVTDYHAMEKGLAVAEEICGAVNGVIHCAGLVGQMYLKPTASLTPADCEEIFAAKITGVQVLAALFEGKKPDFCLCMSSISSVLGGLGHAAYIAANIYMDYFVQQQNLTADFRWLSVNWDGWQTERMQAQREGVTITQDKFAMSPAEGIAACEWALAQNETDLLVHSTADLDARIKQWVTLDSLQDQPRSVFPRPQLDTPYVAPEDTLQQALCTMMQERLGVDKIGINDDFFQLNMDSFIIVQITNMIKKQLNVDIPVVTFYKYPNINVLSAIIQQLGYGAENNG
ncbi:SDR family NAD(P)-dependent oxidoreductase [Brenneria uluponensis]|uniref:SDR family NAD(P)-dependent oxidoreductase n=1 Tax=Brenneria uluponensis TaxID=3057057 RepID=UPI0028EF1593|nr:SDR family NAD(P)-dependent oxidoreductase [Brenneria ulupoensis]